jgi:hypothetical protein
VSLAYTNQLTSRNKVLCDKLIGTQLVETFLDGPLVLAVLTTFHPPVSQLQPPPPHCCCLVIRFNITPCHTPPLVFLSGFPTKTL